jgi:mono/diheme cytochrome c family protein
MRTLMLAAALAASVAGCASPHVRAERDDIIADGRAIAETQCASCHAVGTDGVSPNAAAPPFRTVLSRYRSSALETDLIEGIRIAHAMPDFQFAPEGADSLIAYLQSIQTVAPPEGAADRRRTP